MPISKRLSVIAVLAALGFAAPVAAQVTSPPEGAGPYTDGIVAFQDGDKEAAVQHFREAAAQGHVGAAWLLGVLYEAGNDVPQSDVEAIRYYSQAAEAGHPGAQVRLGLYYKRGNKEADLDRDFNQALKLFEAGAMKRDGESQYQLALMYRDGLGVTPNQIETLRWLILAANKRHALTMLELSDIYFDGRGVEKDPEKGWMYLFLANDLADPSNRDLIGKVYDKRIDIGYKQGKDEEIAKGKAMVEQWNEDHPVTGLP